MKYRNRTFPAVAAALVLGLFLTACSGPASGETADSGEPVQLLHVSFDIAREIFRNLGEEFAVYYKEKTGKTVVIEQSHAGSSGQVRSVVDGVPADLVSMNQFLDIQLLYDATKDRQGGPLIPANWNTLFPNNASPFSSTMAFVVREGNPKGIHDWSDLARDGVEIVVPNLKSTGNGRYSYLNAWAYGLKLGGSQETAREFVKAILKNIVVSATGGRAATNAFIDNGQGDVLLTFESEVNLIAREIGPDQFDVVVPSYGIDTTMYVVTVKKNTDANGTTEIADAFWDFMYSKRGQEIVAESYYRPYDPEVAARYGSIIPDIELFQVDDVFGGWPAAQRDHFADGASYDTITAELGRN